MKQVALPSKSARRPAGPTGRESTLKMGSRVSGSSQVSVEGRPPLPGLSRTTKGAARNGAQKAASATERPRFEHLAKANVPLTGPVQEGEAERTAQFILNAGKRESTTAPKLKPAAKFATAKAAADFVLKAGRR
ncbi:MAG: hypothetical protein J0H19_02835 [Rhodospirillales bacterium]|nr:hypothetical protein [Rhodospirillales bacterium]